MIIREKIFESPDIISLPELEYNEYGEDIDANEWSPEFGDLDSYAFWLSDGALTISNKAGGHPMWARSEAESYSGRIWVERKMISFWIYPDKKLFFDMMEGLSVQLSRKTPYEVDILGDPEWKVEILPSDQENWRPDMYVREENPKTFKTKLIPVNDYQGSHQRSSADLGQKHTKTPIEKEEEKRTVPSHVGSKRYGEKKPLQYRQALVPESLDSENI